MIHVVVHTYIDTSLWECGFNDLPAESNLLGHSDLVCH